MDKMILAGFAIVLIAGVLAGLFLVPKTSPSTENIMDKISHEGIIHACYIVYPPLVIKDPTSSEISGEMVDAFNSIAASAGWKVDYTETAWGTFIGALQSKQCDVVMNGLFAYVERAKAVSFTNPINYFGNSVLVRKGETRFNSLDDFDNPALTIAVIQGEAGHLYAQKNLTHAKLAVMSGGDISLALAQVSSGRADAAFTDAWTIEQYAKSHLETVDFLSVNPKASYGIAPVSWAVRQEDQSLLVFLNNALDVLKAEGTFHKLDEQYGANWFYPAFELKRN